MIADGCCALGRRGRWDGGGAISTAVGDGGGKNRGRDSGKQQLDRLVGHDTYLCDGTGRVTWMPPPPKRHAGYSLGVTGAPAHQDSVSSSPVAATPTTGTGSADAGKETG